MVPLLLVLILPQSGQAHDGAQDEYGCHRSRWLRTYHCHKEPFKGRSWKSRKEARKEMDREPAPLPGFPDGASEDSPMIISSPPEKITRFRDRDWKRWLDEDKNCRSTREEVLLAESLVPVTFKSEKKCKVRTGKWKCPFTGEVFTDPKKLEVIHLVPLENAHASGGWRWDDALKRFYANDLGHPEHLLAVSAKANRKRGAKNPDEWRPSQDDYWCQYAQDWKQIKTRWGLAMTKPERKAVAGMRQGCAPR